jgi:hypothetical protein
MLTIEATKPTDEQKKDFEQMSDFVDKSCKDCYGRGYKGIQNDRLLPCNCLIKNINKRLGDLGRPSLEQEFIKGINNESYS